MPDLSEAEIASTDFGVYTMEQFFDDMFRVTRYRTDPGLCEQLVTKSLETAYVDAGQGRSFRPDLRPAILQGRRQDEVLGWCDRRILGRGPGLVDQETGIARKLGVEIRYNTRATSLIYDGHAVTGVRVKHGDTIEELRTHTVILATRRLRIECGMAYPLSRSRLGPREGARHPVQHR